ncbi:hypothetical protein [Streptosporangium sp. NPDC049046]|uniref:PD-(D/E)XK nuclease domain-containing protein n=1 Tax=Streptosporangium sp. NPDC049046 TaxID=3155031 RepID=UPI00341A089F
MNVDLTFQELTRALARNEAVVAIHYACESFLTANDHPAGIASIALYDLQTGDTNAYSMSDAPPSVEGDDREIHLLEQFYRDISSREDSYFLHWNMNRPEYGFAALAARYEYLTSKAPTFRTPERRVDVDGLFAARYGEDYAPHGKLESVARLNDLDTRSFKNGRTEAELYGRQEWGALARSAASKSKIIGLLLRMLIEGKARTAESAGTTSFAGAKIDAVSLILELGDRMLLVQRSLKVRSHGDPITFENEYDDQYLLRALLTQFFEDIREEEYTPSYAGQNSRIDFLLPKYKLAIELKRTRESLRDGKLGEQLIVDRDRYLAHNSVTHLICLVFDYDGRLRNPRAIEEDLRTETSSPDMAVTVRIYDR